MTVLWLYYVIKNKTDFDKMSKAWFYPVISGMLTLIIACLAYISIGMWPVGDESGMIVDMHHQYAPLLSQLRDMLMNGGSMLYNMEKLKKLRKETGLTVYDMAKKLGITASFYSQIENKKRRLFYDMAIKIAQIFDEKPDNLFYVEK